MVTMVVVVVCHVQMTMVVVVSCIYMTMVVCRAYDDDGGGVSCI